MTEEVWLVWIKDGEHGDSFPVAVRRTLEGAKKYCDYDRKLDKGEPVNWVPGTSGWHRGTSLDTMFPDAGDARVVRQYALQPMELED